MYFTHCFQISFILKSNNLKFSALCLDSTDCVCLVCPTPRSSLSLMRNVWLGKPLILPVSSPYEPELLEVCCANWMWLEAHCKILWEFLSSWHTGIALFPWLQLLCVQCSQVTAGWRPSPPKSFPVHNSNFGCTWSLSSAHSPGATVQPGLSWEGKA